jgi:hypothetical protein
MEERGQPAAFAGSTPLGGFAPPGQWLPSMARSPAPKAWNGPALESVPEAGEPPSHAVGRPRGFRAGVLRCLLASAW